jgi:hypothetical protein
VDDEAQGLAPIGTDESSRLVRQVLGLLDAPAYVRRGRMVDESIDDLKRRCAAQRRQMLMGVAFHLRRWLAMVDQDSHVQARLSDANRMALDALLRFVPMETGCIRPPASGDSARRAWVELVESIARFNRRWDRFVRTLDLTDINKSIVDYNCHYVVEKECALRSARLASRGFRPMNRLTADDFFAWFPLLPILRNLDR